MPGTDVENKIMELLATEDELVIIAKLNPGFKVELPNFKAELSTFNFKGAFISTVPIEGSFYRYKQDSTLATFSINEDITIIATRS